MRPRHPAHIYAVITGDLVGSTKLSRGDMARVRETIDHTVRAFAKRNPEAVRNGVEFFQGDSWQVLLNDPRATLRLALLIEAKLAASRYAKTRAAIGIGTVATLEKKLAISTGEAFTLSGRALDDMTGYFRLTGALPAHTQILARWFPAILHLCSGLMSSWTARQAEVISHWLELTHPTHEAIAANLEPPIAKQSVTDALASAKWRTMIEALNLFQATDWQTISQPDLEQKSEG